MKTSKIKFVIFAIIIAAAIVSGIVIVNNNNNSKFQQQLKLGNEALLNLDYEAAITAFANAIGLNPKDVQAYLGITKAYVAMDDFKNACEYLSKGRVEIPNPSILTLLDSLTAEDFVSLGNEFIIQGDQDSAKDAFEEALKKDPTNEEAQKGMEDAETLLDSENSQDGDSSQDDATSSNGATSEDDAPFDESNANSATNTMGLTVITEAEFNSRIMYDIPIALVVEDDNEYCQSIVAAIDSIMQSNGFTKIPEMTSDMIARTYPVRFDEDVQTAASDIAMDMEMLHMGGSRGTTYCLTYIQEAANGYVFTYLMTKN